jgi:hypothetical protein
MTSWRLFLIAIIIATFVAPAARSENGQPTAQIWVDALSQHSVDRVGQWKGSRLDDADQWNPEAPWPTVAAHTKVAKLIASNIEHGQLVLKAAYGPTANFWADAISAV